MTEETQAAEGNGDVESEGRAGGKTRRSHRERATASLRGAKRSMKDIPEGGQRVELLLAEANVLALLDVADALGGRTPTADDA